MQLQLQLEVVVGHDLFIYSNCLMIHVTVNIYISKEKILSQTISTPFNPSGIWPETLGHPGTLDSTTYENIFKSFEKI